MTNKCIYEKIAQNYYCTKLEYPRPTSHPNYKELIKVYRADCARLEAEFKKDLLEEVGLLDHSKGEMVYNLAYQYGHDAGLSEIMNYADDLAELVK